MVKFVLQRQNAGFEDWFDMAEYDNIGDARNAEWSAWISDKQKYYNIPEELDRFRIVER